MIVRVACCLLLVARLGGVALGQPQNRQEAVEHFRKAGIAEKESRFQDAIDEYLLAYTLVPHADVLFNIGANYEALQQWAKAVEYYQRYLDERDTRPADADVVVAKIRELRAKIPAPAAPPPRPPPPPEPIKPEIIDVVQAPPPPPAPQPPRLHGGLSAGLGLGDVPVERFHAHGGVRLAQRLDLDLILGRFGKNDWALGVMARVIVARTGMAQPFLRGVATIGYAPQDSSSVSETRTPLGFEAGAGVQLGTRGRIEIDAVVRWTFGGWDAASTTADSYVNDDIAFAFDVGFVVDFPFISAAR